MDNNFFAYFQQLELLAFFSGYPLVYAVIFFIAGNKQVKNAFFARMIPLLPIAYALTGTLYLAFQLRNLYPDYSAENIKQVIHQPWLMAWGLLSVLFWIPPLTKKPGLSLVHSLVFFFILARDLFLQLWASPAGKDVVKNDMRIYTDSLLLNLGTFILVLLLSLLVNSHKKKTRP